MKVIAEIGSNWRTADDCVRSVRAAKAAGADVIKFQMFNGEDLYGPTYGGSRGLVPDLEKISEECFVHKIEFMCTAFSSRGYYQVDDFVMAHKIASSEITDENILRTVASFKKPVLLSTGGANYEEINNARRILKDCPVTLMFCVAEYPARVIDFRHLEDMQKHYGLMAHYGYSDHSTDVLNVPLMAKRMGCEVIEKHVNLTDYCDTPDAPHSISGEELSLMVRMIREDLPIKDTFRSNPHKRIAKTNGDGSTGFYRPR